MLLYGFVDSTVTRSGAERRGNRMILFFFSGAGTARARTTGAQSFALATWDAICSLRSERGGGGQIVTRGRPAPILNFFVGRAYTSMFAVGVWGMRVYWCPRVETVRDRCLSAHMSVPITRAYSYLPWDERARKVLFNCRSKRPDRTLHLPVTRRPLPTCTELSPIVEVLKWREIRRVCNQESRHKVWRKRECVRV